VRPLGVEPNAVLSVFRVPPEVEGMRLDVFLVSQFRRTSRTRAQMIIKASAYDASGKPMRANDRVVAEQRICLWRAAWDETPVPRKIDVVYEDEHLLAVDKPAGLPVHPTARYYENTLIKILERERGDDFLTLVHRIDRETSGVLLLAKDAESDRSMKKQLEEREGVEKEYLALTWGVPDPGDGARAFRYERSVELDPESKTGVKMRLGRTDDALYAATRFAVEEVRTRAAKTYARVRCDLETGRQHQIRLHLAALGTPIVGDKLYGADEMIFARGADGKLTEEDHELLELPRHALHAARLSFAHPMTGARITLTAPLPEDLQAFWDDLAPVSR
jgi:23S rRNA pseudouridine1911/1915/1917 synthase